MPIVLNFLKLFLDCKYVSIIKEYHIPETTQSLNTEQRLVTLSDLFSP